MSFFCEHLEFFNLLIALIALLVAIYSIHYTRKCNRPRLFIGNGEIYTDKCNPPLYAFTIQNISPVPVSIQAITFSCAGHPVRVLRGHELAYPDDAIYPNWLEEEPVDVPLVIPPHSSCHAAYRFDSRQELRLLDITIFSGQRIGGLKTNDVFSVHFSYVSK